MNRTRQSLKKRGKKILQLYLENKNFSSYIDIPTDMCFDMLKHRSIGEGAQGNVFSVKFRNDRKEYIIKVRYARDYSLAYHITQLKECVNISASVKDIMIDILYFYDLIGRLSWRKLMTYNGLTKNSTITYDVIKGMVLPIREINCKVLDRTIYYANMNDDDIVVTPGDYVCLSNIYSEAIISLLLAADESCYHFINFYSCVHCNVSDTYNYFIEKMDNSISGIINECPNDSSVYDLVDDLITPSNLMSIFVSIMIMSNKYSVCHNDLAFRNILVRETSKIDKLKKCSTIRYIINDTVYDFQMPKYIYKISDFGLAQKFTEPKVLQYDILTSDDCVFPNFDTHGIYDMIEFMTHINYSLIGCVSDEVMDIIQPINKLLFNGKEEEVAEILMGSESSKETDIFQGILYDVLEENRLMLNPDLFKKVFRKYINHKALDSDDIFIATDFMYKDKV